MNARLEKLAELAAQSPAAVVELGVNRGKSLIAMAKATEAHVYGIDLWDMRLPAGIPDTWRQSRGFTRTKAFETFLEAVATADVADRVTWIKGDTAEIAKAWNRPIGLLHIDAAHDYASVRRDYQGWSPHIVAGGWLCMDDASNAAKVGRVIQEQVMVPGGCWRDCELIANRLFVARRAA